MKVVIIIPTYNERENIARLLPILCGIAADYKHNIEILVVDDSSPDGTADSVKALQYTYRGIHLLIGKKSGLGNAYSRGMKYALSVLKADAIMEMDADFSHNPNDVPRILNELEKNDFVIGSRYVPGGKIPDEWSVFRRLNSKFGNIFARYIAGITNVKDCTAGFRAIRAELLNKISLEDLKVNGYCFQVSLLHAAKVQGARIKEIPVIFTDRSSGISKLGISDIIEFVSHVWIIRLNSARTFIKFALVGLSGILVNLGVFTVLVSMGMNKFLASPISIEISIISNFLLNNFWTFAQRNASGTIGIKGIKFNII